jgi:hypothetical protein
MGFSRRLRETPAVRIEAPLVYRLVLPRAALSFLDRCQNRAPDGRTVDSRPPAGTSPPRKHWMSGTDAGGLGLPSLDPEAPLSDHDIVFWRSRAVEARDLAELTNNPLRRKQLVRRAKIYERFAERVKKHLAAPPEQRPMKFGPRQNP